MARKRLTPANPLFLDTSDGGKTEPNTPQNRPPIANVAAESASTAAIEAMASELAEARESGRMILRIPVDQIDMGHLVRDRTAVNEEDMEALTTSLQKRGQQTPIEVTPLGDGRYGLISGWRRCKAIARLRDWEVGDGMVLALERRPEGAAEAYQAMVEENEIRADLSYFERARIVAVAVNQGVFETKRAALQGLFGTASRPKRSKIGSFITVVEHLDGHLKFPEAIGERLGLRLSRQLESYEDKAQHLRGDLVMERFETSEDELAFLTAWVSGCEAEEAGEQSLTRPKKPKPPPPLETRPRPDMRLRYHAKDNRLEISGAGLTDALREELAAWLASRES
ncbi:ParB/RepB/Spo0J family partition protein [Pacificoceanicola onchidii]|uniref:ParB/RepB/Spo0J family partition protein n=1 Tax=Pacificoceanicola onchidii TaxID=2562685 RepID=UPI001455E432|nr:ParB N-terminal domain-containing protein [Pacificoceanicola onchidii]